MTRLFIMLPEFEKQWKKMGLDDNDLKRLQYELLDNPKIGDVMQDTGGLRKIRFYLKIGEKVEVRELYTWILRYMRKYFLLLHILKMRRIICHTLNEMLLKS